MKAHKGARAVVRGATNTAPLLHWDFQRLPFPNGLDGFQFMRYAVPTFPQYTFGRTCRAKALLVVYQLQSRIKMESITYPSVESLQVLNSRC